MTLRAVGAFNGTLPIPTGMVQGFMRDPAKMPYLRYAQLVPAPEIHFMYAKLDPDEVSRLVDLNEYAWGYDDYRPTGKGFTVRVEWVNARTTRWDFPYTLGEATIRVWKKNGIDTKMLYNRMRSNHAALHRAVRVVNGLTNASWGANAAALNTLMGTAGAYYDKSSGQQYLADGTDNPNFQIIKKSWQRVKRRINLATNAALTGEELCVVMPPTVAEAIASSGEMVEFLKQSQFAERLTSPNLKNWNLPEEYGGFKLVVEDTPRCFINQKADGTVADVTVSSDKDYILNTDTIFFTSRPGGLDGNYGFQNFSTVQIYHFGGEARVEAFTEPKHELVEGHVVMEDNVQVPAVISGFKLTDVLS
jgi:hypothetical protein